MNDQLPIQPNRPIDLGKLGDLGKVGVGKTTEKSDGDGPSFADVLKNSIKHVNALQKEADAAIQDLTTGKTENFTEVLTAVEKADLAFRALMQIRNKLLEAYEEISQLRV